MFVYYSVTGYACISYTGVGVPDTLGKLIVLSDLCNQFSVPGLGLTKRIVL